MAGIGIRLNRIFEKKTVATRLYGFGYSAMITVAPMIIVIATVAIMQKLFGFSKGSFDARELFSCTVLYAFVFSIIFTAPLNQVFSRYLSDLVFEERFGDIRPGYELGLAFNLIIAGVPGIIFCVRENVVGGVELYYVFTGFCAYIAMALTFYTLVFLSICKYYRLISLYFLTSMLITLAAACLFVYKLGMEVPYSMLLALAIGFFVAACLEYATVIRFFPKNSRRYIDIMKDITKYKRIAAANTLYVLGLYIHNFVYWTTGMSMTVKNSFVCATPYDMATMAAMLTNITSTIIFTVSVEMHFSEHYMDYSDAVTGGRESDIQITKAAMFAQLENTLGGVLRAQVIISAIIFLMCLVFLPAFGFSGLVMRIYPCLAAGFFVVFMMYQLNVFMYYFDDHKGTMYVSALFCASCLAGSLLSTKLDVIWFGLGPLLGGTVGWIAGYARLYLLSKNLDRHVFCQGTLLKRVKGRKPPAKVYDRREQRA